MLQQGLRGQGLPQNPPQCWGYCRGGQGRRCRFFLIYDHCTPSHPINLGAVFTKTVSYDFSNKYTFQSAWFYLPTSVGDGVGYLLGLNFPDGSAMPWREAGPLSAHPTAACKLQRARTQAPTANPAQTPRSAESSDLDATGNPRTGPLI